MLPVPTLLPLPEDLEDGYQWARKREEAPRDGVFV